MGLRVRSSGIFPVVFPSSIYEGKLSPWDISVPLDRAASQNSSAWRRVHVRSIVAWLRNPYPLPFPRLLRLFALPIFNIRVEGERQPTTTSSIVATPRIPEYTSSGHTEAFHAPADCQVSSSDTEPCCNRATGVGRGLPPHDQLYGARAAPPRLSSRNISYRRQESWEFR